jgi:hypothetical protein
MSLRVLAFCFAVSIAAGTSGALAQSETIRIEPRPFYGATVTIEEGVRVFRPLPPEKYTIINPNGTPVNLGLSESHVTETKRVTSRSIHKHYYAPRRGRGWGYRSCIPAVGDSC